MLDFTKGFMNDRTPLIDLCYSLREKTELSLPQGRVRDGVSQLRTRLAKYGCEDLHAIHACYLKMLKFPEHSSSYNHNPWPAELWRPRKSI